MAAITPADIQAVVDAWATGLAPRSVRTYYRVLRAILNAAVNADVIGKSPCRGIKLPPPERQREIRFLDKSAVERLAEAMPEAYQPMVYLGAVLGLRFSEVAGLRVGRIDLRRATLEVTERSPRSAVTSCPPTSRRRAPDAHWRSRTSWRPCLRSTSQTGA
jgi:integrase